MFELECSIGICFAMGIAMDGNKISLIYVLKLNEGNMNVINVQMKRQYMMF
jgi:hypothetical protein